MSERINGLLRNHFARYRLVFWYDPEGKMRDIFDECTIDGVDKIALENNEFGVKNRVLKKEPNKKFLIYAPYSQPPLEQDWLLDLEMTNVVFSSDEASLVLQELGLPSALKKVVDERLSFFRNRAERFEPLARLSQETWMEEELLQAMLSIAAARTKSEREKLLPLDVIIVALTAGEAAGERWRHVQEWKLDQTFFDLVKTTYHINLEDKNPRGVLVQLFARAYAYQSPKEGHADRSPSMRSAFVMLDTWRERKSDASLYEEEAHNMEDTLQIHQKLGDLTDEELAVVDIFPSTDSLLLSRFSEELCTAQAKTDAIATLVKKRATTYWYRSDAEDILQSWYDAILDACRLKEGIATISQENPFRSLSKKELWDAYISKYSAIDRAFRELWCDDRRAGSPSAFSAVVAQSRDEYLRRFLTPLSQRWQSLLDAESTVQFDFAPRQDTFFESKIRRAVAEGKRVVVLISDALRWEIGKALAERLEESGKFKVATEPWCAMVPTYTAHGMAALLPHNELALLPGTGDVAIDRQIVAGIDGRAKFLALKAAELFGTNSAIALTTEEIRSMSLNALEERLEPIKLAYIYSSKIDISGHSADADLPRAVEEECDNLIAVVKHLMSLSRTLLFITADHGFLFSGPARDDEFMLDLPPLEGEVSRDHRYILGTNLREVQGLMAIGEPEPAFHGSINALVAKELLKLRRKGASGNFVHGGASLQELAIPVLQISALKREIAHRAALSIFGSRDITTPSITLKIYQEEPVGTSVQPHHIRLWFESADGSIISNKAECIADSSDQEDVNRTYPVSFEFLPSARNYKGQNIKLRICTVAEGGTLVEYQSVDFKLKQIAYDIDLF